jgi:hypothetical protein
MLPSLSCEGIRFGMDTRCLPKSPSDNAADALFKKTLFAASPNTLSNSKLRF